MAYISTEEVRTIRNDLKATFPKFKFSVRYQPNSKSAITVTIKSGPVKFAEPRHGDYVQLNHYHPGNYDNADIFQQIIDVVNKKNYDNSDSMTDYFDVGFYVQFEQGSWKKPYVLTSDKGESKVVKSVPVEDLVAVLFDRPVKPVVGPTFDADPMVTFGLPTYQ